MGGRRGRRERKRKGSTMNEVSVVTKNRMGKPKNTTTKCNSPQNRETKQGVVHLLPVYIASFRVAPLSIYLYTCVWGYTSNFSPSLR